VAFVVGLGRFTTFDEDWTAVAGAYGKLAKLLTLRGRVMEVSS